MRASGAAGGVEETLSRGDLREAQRARHVDTPTAPYRRLPAIRRAVVSTRGPTHLQAGIHAAGSHVDVASIRARYENDWSQCLRVSVQYTFPLRYLLTGEISHPLNCVNTPTHLLASLAPDKGFVSPNCNIRGNSGFIDSGFIKPGLIDSGF
jgi:hypothetical protein